jgi:hypothetical protein
MYYIFAIDPVKKNDAEIYIAIAGSFLHSYD